MTNVLKEYKAKYKEFQNANKFSKTSHKKLAKEVNALGERKKRLEVEYGQLCEELGIVDDPDVISDRIEEKSKEVDAMEREWETEKEELLRQTAAIKEECS